MSSPPLSLLPEDILLLCLARLPRAYHPTLSLVSKYFRSLIASPELDATRLRNGLTEDHLYVCLDIDKEPRWFTVSLIPEERKLMRPIPSFPHHQHPESATVLSMGSEIYIIGGRIDGQRSNRVVGLDCRSHHQWRILQKMRQPRKNPAAEVIDGKIFVIGGCISNNIEHWGEVYDPKTQTWEPVLPKTLGRSEYYCITEKGLRLRFRCRQPHYWNDPEQDVMWRIVQGLDEFDQYPRIRWCYNNSVAKRVTVWWKLVEEIHPEYHHRCTRNCKTEIWCAEVSFERRGLEELWGSVEWSKNMFTIEGSCDSRPHFFLHSAIISH